MLIHIHPSNKHIFNLSTTLSLSPIYTFYPSPLNHLLRIPTQKQTKSIKKRKTNP